MSSPPRIIRKYPNRRLYDTETSSYITLEEIRQLVLTRTPFKVEDKKSGDDITRTILLQIISDQEELGNPVFGTDLLQQIIRLYGDTSPGVLGEFLKKSMSVFLEQQDQFRNAADPLHVMQDMSKKSFEFWSSLFTIEPPRASPPPPPSVPDGGGGKKADLSKKKS